MKCSLMLFSQILRICASHYAEVNPSSFNGCLTKRMNINSRFELSPRKVLHVWNHLYRLVQKTLIISQPASIRNQPVPHRIKRLPVTMGF
ncbi:hypothetical protein B0J14DRAFT_293615 [Halenospora varia]|nr:hypothetical protein B0J14DRAFT_293615 [Halenospora varia]